MNHEKSKIWFSKTVSNDFKSFAENSLSFTSSNSLGKYLVLPLKPTYKKSDFLFILDKLNSKLSGWKRNTLSMAGRIQLINANLSSISSHAMQSFHFPKSIHKKIDSLNINFLWGHNDDTKKLHHTNWNTITKPKNLGGLGIMKSIHTNVAFMDKIKWNINTKQRITYLVLVVSLGTTIFGIWIYGFSSFISTGYSQSCSLEYSQRPSTCS